jgi:large subunit ribosomal protein L20
LAVKNIDLNRKVLADLAMNEPESFKKLVDQVK